MDSNGAHVDETVYLIGPSGWPNYGDEYIVATWLRYLAQAKPDAEVVLDCPSPGVATYLFDGIHPRLKITDMIWRTIFASMDRPDEEADPEIDRMITNLGTPRWDIGLLGARRATTIHLIGGGHITDLWPHHLRLLRAGMRLREVSGAKLVATGLGLTPTNRGEVISSYLAEFDHATVRDAPSAEASGVEAICDDAFLDLPNLAAFATRGRSNEIVEGGEVVISLQRDLASEDVFEENIELVRDLLTGPYAGRPVRYVEAIPGNDRIAFDRLADLIPEENFVSFVRLWSEPFFARPGQTWITTRFHLHLLAASCGAEGIAMEINDDYYRAKHQSLLDLGTGWARYQPGDGQLPAASIDTGFRLGSARLHRAKLAEADSIYR